MNRSEKIRASYVAIASVGENPRPQLDATSPENGLRIPVNRSEKIRASYVAIASVGENPRPQLDATSPVSRIKPCSLAQSR